MWQADRRRADRRDGKEHEVMTTKIKRLMFIALAALLLAGSGMLALPAGEALASNHCNDTTGDSPVGG